MTLKGFDEFKKKMDKLQQGLKSLDGEHKVCTSDLFNGKFMTANTRYASFEAMCDASGFKVESAEDFHAIPPEKWDAFVKSVTRFASWEEMQTAAAGEWATKMIGLN
jgi:hypothetical protein